MRPDISAILRSYVIQKHLKAQESIMKQSQVLHYPATPLHKEGGEVPPEVPPGRPAYAQPFSP